MSRIPLIAAVVGALLIGGATTGSTRASWTSQAPLHQISVSSGQMSYTATTPAGVVVNKMAGSTADTTFDINDISQGKNLAQRITATVGTTPAGVTATIGATCLGSASVSVNTTPTGPRQSLCVRVTSSENAVDGNVTIALSSAQWPTAGWTTPPITKLVAVTVHAPSGPSAPTGLSCTGGNGTSTLTWSTVASATSYQIFRTGNTMTPIRTVTTNNSGAMTEAVMGSPVESSQKYSLVVKAFVGTTPSSASAPYTIQFKPNGGCAG